MKYIVTKDNKIYCQTTVSYPPEIVKQMKKAGYKIKEVKE